MKVICWNMGAGFGSNAVRHAQAWDWLLAQAPDAALLQEATIPEDTRGAWGSIAFSPQYNKVWGSAVLTRTSGYTKYEPTMAQPWLREIAGAVSIARPREAGDLWLVSLHSSATPYKADQLAALPSLDGIARCSDDALWQIDVAIYDLRNLLSGQRFIVGGDLNSALLFDQLRGTDSNRRLLNNIAAAGLVDLRLRHFDAEQRTFFRDGNGPYQLDHVFSDRSTEPLVTSWRVATEVVTELRLSDHAPIMLTLDRAAA